LFDVLPRDEVLFSFTQNILLVLLLMLLDLL